MKNILLLIGTLSLSFLITSCESDDTTSTTPDEELTNPDISVLSAFYATGNTSFTINESTIVITSTSQPDHTSAYYPVTHPLYEAYNASDFNQNPNQIVPQTITMTVPRYPSVASNHTPTALGSIGIAVNSVSLYNQYAAPGDNLTDEIITFDQWEGHPQMQGNYHYHLESPWLTQQHGNEGLVGILLDGFPVYGTHENGIQITNADLDAYHGHTSSTPEFPNGIYHYHVTTEAPYINGDGYYGTPGWITN